jgi:hypothetical protein
LASVEGVFGKSPISTSASPVCFNLNDISTMRKKTRTEGCHIADRKHDFLPVPDCQSKRRRYIAGPKTEFKGKIFHFFWHKYIKYNSFYSYVHCGRH